MLAQAFEFEALLNVLERRGLIVKAEVPEEIKRLRARTPEAKSRLALALGRAERIGAIRQGLRLGKVDGPTRLGQGPVSPLTCLGGVR